MFTNYVLRVIETYRLKKEEGELSLHLTEPTPSKLKSECMIVYSERFREKDNKALRLFFQTNDNTTDYSASIRNIDTDKFKPLCNFLKGRTSDTDAKNIELLSWLIDFEPRPYDHRNRYDATSGFDQIESDDGKHTDETDQEDGLEAAHLTETIKLETERKDDHEEVSIHDESEIETSDPEEGFNHPNSKNSEDSENFNNVQFPDNELDVLHGENKGGIDENDLGEAKQPSSGFKLKKILITSGVAASILLGGYFSLNEKSDVKKSIKQENKIDSSAIQGEIKITSKDTFLGRTPREKENAKDRGKPITKIGDVPEAKCMYWNEDHYQKVFCNDENITGKPIPLDKGLLENFRKITFPDTITLKSEGKIWYSKSDGKLEYFTRPGIHPTNNKPLKEISDYIIKTHILKN
ncbi:hypothetical protein [Chryseobacterium sp. JM1]|uniref:hypothetical protein n=1 Tax=Chryseobacterium sp. JM1 TaxID=1233950 RepID=UPI0004E77E49|nr:hypothetical protein [Chryseobacterium sp. JM1]KFF22598.1 hypothetical protein IW22_05355 [Chryseobacterium sp. JM1]